MLLFFIKFWGTTNLPCIQVQLVRHWTGLRVRTIRPAKATYNYRHHKLFHITQDCPNNPRHLSEHSDWAWAGRPGFDSRHGHGFFPAPLSLVRPNHTQRPIGGTRKLFRIYLQLPYTPRRRYQTVRKD
jgi:hypothetical protein